MNFISCDRKNITDVKIGLTNIPVKVSQRQRSIYLFVWKRRRYSSFDREKMERSVEYSMERREKRRFDNWEASNYPSECHVLQCSSRHMAGRHPFLGTCATYFEAPAFRFPRPEGFPERKECEIYLGTNLERETTDYWPMQITQFSCNNFPLSTRIIDAFRKYISNA